MLTRIIFAALIALSLIEGDIVNAFFANSCYCWGDAGVAYNTLGILLGLARLAVVTVSIIKDYTSTFNNALVTKFCASEVILLAHSTLIKVFDFDFLFGTGMSYTLSPRLCRSATGLVDWMGFLGFVLCACWSRCSCVCRC